MLVHVGATESGAFESHFFQVIQHADIERFKGWKTHQLSCGLKLVDHRRVRERVARLADGSMIIIMITRV